MIRGAATGCFQNMSSSQQQQQQGLQIYSMAEDHNVSSFSLDPNSSAPSGPGQESHSSSLLYSLSVLKEKVHQAKSLVNILISPDHHHPSQPPESTNSIAIASMSNVIQEIIVTASSMMFTCQQMALVPATTPPPGNQLQPSNNFGNKIEAAFYPSSHDQTLDWFSDNYMDNCNPRDNTSSINKVLVNNNNNHMKHVQGKEIFPKSYDIIELDAADLLAKYTHYCQVCGKGFKRDANLRMHMRAHGDEYKTSVALSNPLKKTNNNSTANNNNNHNSADDDDQKCSSKVVERKYSCPQEGCRWNQKHAKFQPLKSMICVKNHYKRSHCPKMYVCKRCNRKQFSVLSDLRTHEKHCGDLRWQCSCGTTFSRKDKLMGHVALFIGHTPVMVSSLTTRTGKADHNHHQISHGSQMQLE